MADGEITLKLQNRDQRLLVIGLVEFRKELERQGAPTEDVSRLIMKVIDARHPGERRRSSEAR